MYKGERERIDAKNYWRIGLLSLVGRNFVGLIVDRAHRVTERLIDYEQRSLGSKNTREKTEYVSLWIGLTCN